VYIYNTRIKLFDTDAAGILFFGNHFRLVEEAYEAFLSDQGISISDIIKNRKYMIPIVHAEADYLEPLTPGEAVTIKTELGEIGVSSFRLNHTLEKPDGKVAGRGNTVHVCVLKKNFTKIKIPEEIDKILKSL